ncbi:MAG TPA: hypothetical protein VMU34_27155, partial [Mycobacterium sp.]|nr:hypothetical protein [Mycobacterium sp.]
ADLNQLWTCGLPGYGADAVVLEPEALREEVLARLRAQAGRVRRESDIADWAAS